MGLPWYLSSKDSACNAVGSGWIPVSRRSPVEGNGNPLQYLLWKIPWTQECGRLQSMGLQTVGHNLETKQQRSYIPSL